MGVTDDFDNFPSPCTRGEGRVRGYLAVEVRFAMPKECTLTPVLPAYRERGKKVIAKNKSYTRWESTSILLVRSAMPRLAWRRGMGCVKRLPELFTILAGNRIRQVLDCSRQFNRTFR